MAARKKTSGNVALGLAFLAILIIIGIPLTIVALSQSTMYQQHAAELPQLATDNLNSATEIVATRNPDGTMGPVTWSGNASNAIPQYLRGTLFFKVIDPSSRSVTHMPEQAGNNTVSVSPMQQGQGNDNKPTGAGEQNANGPQTVTALSVVVRKVEVHMAYQGVPSASVTPGEKAAHTSPSPETGKVVDHWETLNIASPVTLDLVQLAKTHDFTSLGFTSLAAGRYTEVRMYLSSATATLEDGTTVQLGLVGHDNIIRIVRSFTIQPQAQTTLTVDIDAQRSVIKAGNTYLLRPVVARFLQD